MKWTKGLLATSLAFAMTVTLVTPSDAARRDALLGNALIVDGDDIYQFPQLTLDHVNLVRFEMGADGGTGEGRFVFGTKTFAMSLSANRQDFTGNATNNAFGQAKHLLAAPGATPWTVADLNFAFDLDGDKAGVRIAIGNGGSTQADDNVDATGEGNLVFVLGGGYSTSSETLKLDLGANLSFSSYGTIADGDVVQSGSNLSINLGGRGYYGVDEELSIGFLAGFGFTSWGVYDDAADAASGETDWSLAVAAGPVYNIKDKAQVSGYLGISLQGFSGEPNDTVDDDEVSTMDVAIPFVNLAAEVWVYDWMAFRAGVGYNYNISTTGAVANDTQTAAHEGNFAWTAGLGFKVEDFTFDGSLQSAWLTQGPAALGGTGAGLFGTVAANYSF
jgi:hypothetical protein